MLLLFPNCLTIDADIDKQQQQLQGDAFKKEMTSKMSSSPDPASQILGFRP
jgi:hypothetical protein